MVESCGGSSSSSAVGTPPDLLIPLDEAAMVLLSPTAQKKRRRRRRGAQTNDVVAVAGGKDGRYADADYGHHSGYNTGSNYQGHGTNMNGGASNGQSRLSDRRPKTVVTLQDLGFDLGMACDTSKAEPPSNAWGQRGDGYSSVDCACSTAMGGDCYGVQGMHSDCYQQMAGDCYSQQMQGASYDNCWAAPPPETPCRGMVGGARNLGITSTCPMAPPPTGVASGAGEAAARGQCWPEPLMSPCMSPSRVRAPPTSPVLATDGGCFNGAAVQLSPSGAIDYSIMSTAPASSPKRVASQTSASTWEATLGLSPAGSTAADAVRTWLHSSGLAVGADLETRLREIAPETYED